MGLFKKDKVGELRKTSARLQVVQNRLDGYHRKLQSDSAHHKDMARRYLKEGDERRASMHAKRSLANKQILTKFQAFETSINNIRTVVEEGGVIANLEEVTRGLESLVSPKDFKKISERLSTSMQDITEQQQIMDATMEEVTATIPEDVDNRELDDFMRELVAETEAEQGVDIQLKDLEKKLKRSEKE